MRRTLLLAALFSLALPAGASAATRWASPGGTHPECAPPPFTCSLPWAIESAQAGDEIVVTPGTYLVESTLKTETPLNIHGQTGQPQPLIVGAAGVTPFESFERQRLSDLAFEASGTELGTLAVLGEGSELDRLKIIATGREALALRAPNRFTLTNSLLVAKGIENGGGVFVQGTETQNSELRNDTVIASGREAIAIDIFVTKPGAHVAMEATNVIAQGDTHDAAAEVGGIAAEGGGTAAITFDHSNLDSWTGPVTALFSQTAPPLFVNAAAGDYHELFNSPTVDAGLTSAGNGLEDLDGHPRALSRQITCTGYGQAVTDIGAYEFVPTAPACVPSTQLVKAWIRGRRAKFAFTGAEALTAISFLCKLDRGPFRPCTSPRAYKHLKPGRHLFQVKAGADGGFDATPAKRRFRIHPRHHRRHKRR